MITLSPAELTSGGIDALYAAANALDVLFVHDTPHNRKVAEAALLAVRDLTGSFDAQIQREAVLGAHGAVASSAWATWAHGWRVRAEEAQRVAAGAPWHPF